MGFTPINKATIERRFEPVRDFEVKVYDEVLEKWETNYFPELGAALAYLETRLNELSM